MQSEFEWRTFRKKFGINYIESTFAIVLAFVVFPILIVLRRFILGYQPAISLPATKKTILLYGAYGNQSIGDDAILLSILQNLRLLESKPDIIVSSYRPEETSRRYDVKTVCQGVTLDGLVYLWKILGNVDIVLFGGGGVLETHDTRLRIQLSVIYKMLKILLALLYGKKIVFFAIGANVAPFNMFLNSLIKFIGNRAEYITTRDMSSAELLSAIGIEDNKIKFTADVAFLLKRSGNIRSRAREAVDSFGQREIVGINVMPYYSIVGEPQKAVIIQKKLAAVVNGIVEELNRDIIFIPMVAASDPMEQQGIKQWVMHKEHVFELSGDFTPEEIIYILSKLDVFIGMRLHSNILSIHAGTPFFGIGYHSKVQKLCQMMGCDEFYIPLKDIDVRYVMEKCQELIVRRGEFVEKMTKKRDELGGRAKENFHVLDMLLQGQHF